ncbi:MAG: hypothetical protein COA43_12785 [Robiginitomaculum sp.]|nr:MAG: hypothetical protein COA43_12785 [Robiginitomaculum sp.]
MTRVQVPEATMSRSQKLGIITAILAMGSASLGFGYSAPVIAQNLERMTSSGALLGWLISVGAVMSILITPITPKLLSKFNAKWIMVIALIIGALCFPLYKLFWSVNAWFLVRLVQSSAFAILFVVVETWINQLAPDHLRGRILGMYGTALAGGFGIGSGIAVFVATFTGIESWPTYLIGGSLFLIGLVPFIFLKGATNVVPPPKEHAGFKPIIIIVFAAPSLMACGIVFGAIEQLIFHFIPVYVTRLGNTEHMGRMLLLVATIGNALFQYPMGMLADRVNREKLMLGLMGVAFIGPIFMVMAGDHFVLLGCLLFLYVGLATAIYTVGLVLLAERFHGPRIAAANAAFIFAYAVGSLIIPPVSGIMMDIFVPYGFMWTLAGLGCAGFSVVFVRKLMKKPRQNG